ncbi:hypothetical protein PIB30_113685, partial [Stylosanthes scabra]|nr:hypothetical protein [Stylosanthes scabra]
MVINVFEAMQHLDEEEAEECMKLDVIDKFVQEVQEEEILMKTKAFYEETFATFNASDDIDIEIVLQDITEESLHKNKQVKEESLKKIQKEEEEIAQKNEEGALQENTVIMQNNEENSVPENQVNTEKESQSSQKKTELKPLPANL